MVFDRTGHKLFFGEYSGEQLFSAEKERGLLRPKANACSF